MGRAVGSDEDAALVEGLRSTSRRVQQKKASDAADAQAREERSRKRKAKKIAREKMETVEALLRSEAGKGRMNCEVMRARRSSGPEWFDAMYEVAKELRTLGLQAKIEEERDWEMGLDDHVLRATWAQPWRDNFYGTIDYDRTAYVDPETMTPLVKDLNARMKRARTAAARKADREREARQRAFDKRVDEIVSRTMAELPEKLKAAAAEGDTSYTVYQWYSSEEMHAASSKVAERCKKMGMTTHVDKMEPFGSDPMFYHTVYSLIVRW